MTELDGYAGDTVKSILAGCVERMTQRGEYRSGSGTLSWMEGALAIHTDFGPKQQDKDTNQDFVVAWVGGGQETPCGIVWALAMADGVTASYRAEVGAELACFSGLDRLLTSRGTPDEKARAAANAVGDAIGAVVDVIEEDPQRHTPEGMFDSTWRFTLREGLLLQTTLTLAWLEDGVCHLAIVGDGGAAVDFQRESKDEPLVIAKPNMETSRVYAIGPSNCHVDYFDCLEQVAAKNLSAVAIYTDGVGHGIGPDGHELFQRLSEYRSESASKNVAELLIGEWIRTRAEDFDDNLSLAIVTWD